MNPIFKKLKYKDQKTVLVMNAPDSFLENMEEMKAFARVESNPKEVQEIEFALVFAMKLKEVADSIASVGPKLKGDAILWYAYPKGTSKKYKGEFNRDNGWAAIGPYDMEPVMAIAIDEDWSAIRFRKVDYIKKITRDKSWVLSEKGKAKKSE
ncbi:hypothetical protein [Penaeicola halotolerans]|uniref:hypothetical protein n=1 Tax=Penaeicola halotolerans TaxID=2793196 RepID=UPI001CF9252C|nr:hypothetical protein [Penaeicola halotolerans]